ncbi:MAG: hypothetical protein C0516_03400 [Gemmatimonas sp.]|uniref:alkaline phosphatase family protein n=1 Tax=Gemmatimonas sp. UBA7669 TaxID=1946568 RepID=UPI0025BB22F5|nr:alkaline phosphatase family protein [Gemmatimonas sp. UBA7669]MBA3917615.1 hypothetical protein [Gemmatimonas sp.]
MTDTTHDTTGPAHLLLVVADGVRPDVLAEEMAGGRLPALRALAVRGGLHTVSASFPSVTGPAYVPFLMGRHPASAGLPGLRWFDRQRSLRWAAAPARSYAGIDIWQVDRDVHAHLPTVFEMAQPSLSAMSMLGRGVSHGHVGRSVAWMLRAAPSHFRGDLFGWQRVEQRATAAFFRRFSAVRPRISVLALTSPDKFAHKYGPHAPAVRQALADIDMAVTTAHTIAARDVWSAPLHVWVVGDHGHAPVTQHEDLHAWLESRGLRVLAHPQLFVSRPDVALMVGGNAMAHLYLHPEERARRWWSSHAARWEETRQALLRREAVDLVVVADNTEQLRVAHAARGEARIVCDSARQRWSYDASGGDPLQLGGSHADLDRDAAWELTTRSPYPDAVVQLALLAPAPRSGDIIVSASAGWDLRARYEPVAHRSTHGALLREQMDVPLLLDLPVQRQPQRTTDVVPSALDLLRIPHTQPWDGRSFLR